MDENKLTITQHCAERYAERIMGREEKSDIAVYVAQNKEKIETDINKLYQYGNYIYTGSLKDHNVVNVYVNGTWVLLTDKENKRAVTMYKIDFGLGEEFNKEFVNRMLDKISETGKKCASTLREIDEEKKRYQEMVADFEQQANEYRKIANNLDKQVKAYSDIISVMDDRGKSALEDLKQSVMQLVCKKEF